VNKNAAKKLKKKKKKKIRLINPKSNKLDKLTLTNYFLNFKSSQNERKYEYE